MSSTGLDVTGTLSANSAMSVTGTLFASTALESNTLQSNSRYPLTLNGDGGMRFQAGGAETMSMSTAGLDVTGALSVTGTLFASSALQSNTLQSDSSSALILNAQSNGIGFGVNSSGVMVMTSTGLDVTGTLSASSSLSVTGTLFASNALESNVLQSDSSSTLILNGNG